MDFLPVLIFRVGGEWMALPASCLGEVTDARVVHTIPHRRNGVLMGVTSVRGELLICVSLHRILGIDILEAHKTLKDDAGAERFLVLQQGGLRATLAVDEIHGIERYPQRDCLPVPDTVARSQATYCRALLRWRERAVGLLNEQLLYAAIEKSLL